MTYRELLKQERPDKVSPVYSGGCYGCPGHYWMLAPISPLGCHAVRGNCHECWSRTVPIKGRVPSKSALMEDILKPHIGHDIAIAFFRGTASEPQDVNIICRDCDGKVLISVDSLDREEAK